MNIHYWGWHWPRKGNIRGKKKPVAHPSTLSIWKRRGTNNFDLECAELEVSSGRSVQKRGVGFEPHKDNNWSGWHGVQSRKRRWCYKMEELDHHAELFLPQAGHALAGESEHSNPAAITRTEQWEPAPGLGMQASWIRAAMKAGSL